MFKKIILIIAIAVVFIMIFSCQTANVENDTKYLNGKEQDNSDDESKNAIGSENIAERTIMYYMIGSDLEENSLASTDIINDICKVKFPNTMNFIMMTGGSVSENVEVTRQDSSFKEKYSKYYDISWGRNQILKFTDGYRIIESDFGNDDMSDGKTLEKFVEYVKDNYPAKRYDIIFSDHGGAGLYGFGTDTRYSEKSSCLSIKELTEAFKNADVKFNTVGFDACLMASFELMYVLEPYADYLIAAEETAFGGWDYSFLEKVVNDVTMDSVEYGKAVVDGFIVNSDSVANSLGVYSLSGFKSTVDESLTKFSQNMNKYLVEDNYLQALYAILKETIGLGYISIGDVRDMMDFLSFIAYDENLELPQDLKTSAAELWDKVETFVIYYRTRKQKSESGTENTGGVNFVFPVEDVYYYEDKVDSAITSMKNYPDSLNEEYRLMYKLAFLRKALIKELKENTYEYDDKEVLKVLNDMCQRGIDTYKIPKNYIDSIKENIVQNLAANRLKSGPNGNIDFEKNVSKNKEITFDYKFDLDMAWMVYEPVATARTYGIDGKELKLGDAVLPMKESTSGNYLIWIIKPEEDRWFTIKYEDEERLVQFVTTEDDRNENDPSDLNYIFDKSISGFIPAVLRRYENDNDEENIIQIHVEFNGKNAEGEIIGFTRYDQNANMSAKELESFKKSDSLVLIANFEDFKTTKNISYLYGDELDVSNIKLFRGYTDSQSVDFKYSIEDIYGEIYDCDVPNIFGFELNDDSDLCFYATLPSTWTDVTINQKNSSFESTSVLGKHTEKLSVDLYDVTDDAHFSDMDEGEEYSESTINYLEKSVFSDIDYTDQMFLQNETSKLPVLFVVGDDKNNNFISKKYVFFERDDKKYVIELSSEVAAKENDYSTYHDVRLLRTALELISNVSEKDDSIPMLNVKEKK